MPAQADLFSELFTADPHGALAALRRDSPVRPIELPTGVTGWLVTRYADVRQALTDPRLSKGGLVSPVGYAVDLPDDVQRGANRHVLTVDPPDHTRLRRLLASAFTARRVEALRPRVQEITDGLLDALDGRDRFDLVDELAFPLPMGVICELLGVPVADWDAFRAWSNVLVAGMALRDELPGAYASMVGYIRELIAAKRADPGEDLVSALIQAHDEGDRLSEDELSSTLVLLLIAGHETTVNLIANGTYLLLTHRDQWDRLRAEPALLPDAVEELLRYESPVQSATYRIATAELELGGQTIAAGQPVLISLLSANRDDERFPEPHRFDVGRTANPHLAFGHGIHFCLGAPLARLEGRVAFGALLARFPGLRLAVPAGELAWRPGALMRGLTALPCLAR